MGWECIMGPLDGLKIIEMGGLGPAPFCGMLLADQGAEVLCIERARRNGPALPPEVDYLNRGKRSLVLDLKQPAAVEAVLRLCESADALIEGFRPGVMERLGLGPEACRARNPRLVYGRMTGWGQDGPLAHAAGHDLNYIALTGALHAIGPAGGKPVPPLNLVGDFGGGAMFLAFGVLAALLDARRSGLGQVVDAAMVDGAALLMAMQWSWRAAGQWQDRRGGNLLDGGAPFYDTYETADGKYVAIGSLEPQFYAELVRLAGLDDAVFARQDDPAGWPAMRDRLAAIIATRSRDDWCAMLEGSDACFAPVLAMAEAPYHRHNAARGTFAVDGAAIQPGPAPRFSRTPPGPPRPAPVHGADNAGALAAWGVPPEEIAALRQAGGFGPQETLS